MGVTLDNHYVMLLARFTGSRNTGSQIIFKSTRNITLKGKFDGLLILILVKIHMKLIIIFHMVTENKQSQLFGNHQSKKLYVISVTIIALALKAYGKDIPFGFIYFLNKSVRDENPICRVQFSLV